MAPGGYQSNNFTTYESPRFELPTDEPMDETQVEDETLKKEINNLIWMLGPAKMPLRDAESMACKMFELFIEAKDKFK